MANKQSAASPDEEQSIEVRVGKPAAKSVPADLPPLDIFAKPKTAPAVPLALRKKIAVSEHKDVLPALRSNVPVLKKQQLEPPIAVDSKLDEEIEDPVTDAAVDAIAARDGDQILADEDIANERFESKQQSSKLGLRGRIKKIFRSKRTWAAIIIILIVLGVVPWTRYKIAGLIIKKNVSVSVLDSKTDTPVSSALVTFNGRSAKTDASGIAVLRAPVGTSTLQVSKGYYKTTSERFTIGFSSNQAPKLRLVATGRQVPITVVDKISGKPLAGVTVSVLHVSAKTNSSGQATIVLPTTNASDAVSLSESGYNTLGSTVQVTDQAVLANTFTLTPSGKIYYLSTSGGVTNVVKSNLDGSGQETVLAGSGNETASTTQLIASSDWRYLVLEAQRTAGSGPGLYLIDTSDDQVTQFDSGAASFTPVGWVGHNFVYDVVRSSTPADENGHESLKSYDADNGTPNQLDEDQEVGTSTSYAYQTFQNFYIENSKIVYTTQWSTYSTSGSNYSLSNQTDTVRTIQSTGAGKQDLESWPAANVGYITSVLPTPAEIYYAVYDPSAGTSSYYQYQNAAVAASSITSAIYSKTYPLYSLSPAGTKTFWSTLVDGVSTFYTGDQNAQNQSQLAAIAGFSVYGWYTNNYVLLSKDHDQLYIAPLSGPNQGSGPLLISNYSMPSQVVTGNGTSSYGGL